MQPIPFEKILKERLCVDKLVTRPVSGGDINEAYKLEAANKRYFLKYNEVGYAYPMFKAEKAGLELLGQDGVCVPKVFEVFHVGKGAALLMEWMETNGVDQAGWSSFGQSLTILHQTTAESFGLDHDNYIGRLPQKNTVRNDWLSFYALNRIGVQLKLAIDGGRIPPSYANLSDSAISIFGKDLPPVEPALLHGDLWRGNLLFTVESEALFIDPAVYFGHREMDIAMMKLFGGFGPGLEAYQAIYPLEKNWEERMKFYQLYYILVHVNLFGGSYVPSAKRILEHYARKG